MPNAVKNNDALIEFLHQKREERTDIDWKAKKRKLGVVGKDAVRISYWQFA